MAKDVCGRISILQLTIHELFHGLVYGLLSLSFLCFLCVFFQVNDSVRCAKLATPNLGLLEDCSSLPPPALFLWPRALSV